MGISRAQGLALCFSVAVAGAGVAQSTPAVAMKGGAPGVTWRQKEIRFSDETPLVGLSGVESGSVAKCSTDGTAFFYLSEIHDGPAGPKLLRVSSAGEIKNLQRKMPTEYTSISVQDFFPAEHQLVALLRAERRDEDSGRPRDTRYFLSTSDHDGDHADLIELELKFKPLKVALFGSGEYLVLGWDEVNLQPVLVTLKEDGTIRRFVDLDRKPSVPYRSYGSMKEAETAPEPPADRAMLQRAAFVPFGSQVLLTYAGTARSVRVLSGIGAERAIPIQLPSGFVLHDVLASGPRYTLVMRAEEKRTTNVDAKADPALMLRMFEMNSNNGSLLQEFYFDKPRMADVTCAPDNRLTAIFMDSQENVVNRDAGSGPKPVRGGEESTSLVSATSRR